MKIILFFICVFCPALSVAQSFSVHRSSDLKKRAVEVVKNWSAVSDEDFFYPYEGALNQPEDTLYYNGNVILWGESPLLQLNGINESVFHDIRRGGGTFHTVTYDRGFLARWRIANDSLFLENIYPVHCDGDTAGLPSPTEIRLRVEKLTGRMFSNGRLFADWVSGLRTGGGNFIPYRGKSFRVGMYKDEYRFVIENGKIKSCNIYFIPEMPYDSLKKLASYLSEKIAGVFLSAEAVQISSPLQRTVNPDKFNRMFKADMRISLDAEGAVSEVVLPASFDPAFGEAIVRAMKELPPGSLSGYFLYRFRSPVLTYSVPLEINPQTKQITLGQ